MLNTSTALSCVPCPHGEIYPNQEQWSGTREDVITELGLKWIGLSQSMEGDVL